MSATTVRLSRQSQKPLNMNALLIVIFATSNALSDKFWSNEDHCGKISQCLHEISQICLYNKPTVLIFEDSCVQPNCNSDTTMVSKCQKQMSAYTIPAIISNNVTNLNEIKDIFDGSPLVVAIFEDIKSISERDLVFYEGVMYLIIIKNWQTNLELLSPIASKVQTRDVTFILADHKEGEHVFLTIIPSIDEQSCGLNEYSQLTYINSCKNGSLTKKKMEDIFPSTVPKNLKLCPFNVGMATMFPYSMILNKDSLQNLDPIGEAEGSDIEMIKIIAENINATLHMYYIYREEENPYLHTEYLHFLFNRSLDACAGGLYRIFEDSVAYSGIYTLQKVIWVYTVDREIRSWQSLAHKLSDVYYFIVVFVIYSVIWHFVKKFDMNSVPFKEVILYSWGALVGAGSLQEARSAKQKILNIFYLIMSLHLSAYVGAQTYSYLTIQGPPQVYRTADELRASDKKLYLQYSTKFFIDDKKYEAFANSSGDCKDFRHCENTIMNNKGATIIIEAYLLPFQAETAVDDEARVLRLQESVLTVYHEMIMRKDFTLAFKVQDIVSRLFEAGICEQLYNEAIGITVVDRSKIANKNILSNSYSCTVGCAITLNQLGGAFYIWLFGCLLSLCVFIIEVILCKQVVETY